jgi:hypothetical protein
MSQSFLTGSRVYGTPTPDSDIDLCVVVSSEHLAMLTELADGDGKSSNSIRFGKLNLICLSPVNFTAWQESTERLTARKPVTREDAVKEIQAAMKAARKAAKAEAQ